jgi:hypothetical protein
LKRRFQSKAERQILLGLLFAFLGLFFIITSPVLGIGWIAFVAVPTIAYGFYKTRRIRQEVEVHSSPEEVAGNLVDEELRFAYRDLLVKYMRMFGPLHGTLIFERQIERYMSAGLSREEAVRKLALEEGFI